MSRTGVSRSSHLWAGHSMCFQLSSRLRSLAEKEIVLPGSVVNQVDGEEVAISLILRLQFRDSGISIEQVHRRGAVVFGCHYDLTDVDIPEFAVNSANE